ncbi:MAG: glycerol-3-phosphate 1-O-acyltransferase PlsY [Clostridia bacterium]|nr:glycerol-3-phosphate 1-O-acyltransferase PlsY [Clostridia bacterium]
MTVILAIFTVIISYLLGSINFAVIFSKAFSHQDIRESGSGNAGTTNVIRVNGFVPGILTFIFDALKGFAACKLGEIVFSNFIYPNLNSVLTVRYSGAYLCAVACIIGHIFPLFFNFRGGKGVATCVGIFTVCCPIAIIIGLIVFALVTLISKYVSLGSLVATVIVVILATVFRNGETPAAVQIICCLIMGGLIYYKHISNIKRLLAGKENKINDKA